MAQYFRTEDINKINNELKIKCKNINTVDEEFSVILKIKDELIEFYESNKYLYEMFPEIKM